MTLSQCIKGKCHCISYKKFNDTLDNESTIKGYNEGLSKFIKFMKPKSHDDILKSDNAKLEDAITAFIKLQKENQLSYSTIRKRVAGVKQFMEMNRRPLAWKFITKHIGKATSRPDRAYKHEEIKTLLEHAKPREQAIILLMTSSGIRIGAVPELKLKHLKPIQEYGLYLLTVYEGQPEQYLTFCTPEARKAIDTYIDYRKRYGEEFSPESPLFREEFDKRDLDSVNNPRPIGDKRIRASIDELAVSAGVKNRVECNSISPGKIRHEVKILHGMKKYTATNMIRAKVERTYREYMLSHKKGRSAMGVDNLEMIYDRPEATDFLKEYLKAVDHLTIDNSNRLQNKVDRLGIENEQYKIALEKREVAINQALNINAQFMKAIYDVTKQSSLDHNVAIIDKLLETNPQLRALMEKISQEPILTQT